MRVAFLSLLLVLVLAACGNSGSTSEQMVWCFAPGEEVTSEKKQEYPELYMTKEACEPFNEGQR